MINYVEAIIYEIEFLYAWLCNIKLINYCRILQDKIHVEMGCLYTL